MTKEEEREEEANNQLIKNGVFLQALRKMRRPKEAKKDDNKGEGNDTVLAKGEEQGRHFCIQCKKDKIGYKWRRNTGVNLYFNIPNQLKLIWDRTVRGESRYILQRINEYTLDFGQMIICLKREINFFYKYRQSIINQTK